MTVGVANAMVRGLRADDVFLNSGPLFHLGTWMCTLAMYVLGATNVFVPRVEAELLLAGHRGQPLYGRLSHADDDQRSRGPQHDRCGRI